MTWYNCGWMSINQPQVQGCIGCRPRGVQRFGPTFECRQWPLLRVPPPHFPRFNWDDAIYARKTHQITFNFSKFSNGACPRTPLVDPLSEVLDPRQCIIPHIIPAVGSGEFYTELLLSLSFDTNLPQQVTQGSKIVTAVIFFSYTSILLLVWWKGICEFSFSIIFSAWYTAILWTWQILAVHRGW